MRFARDDRDLAATTGLVSELRYHRATQDKEATISMPAPVLVVDDEPMVRKLLARALERNGADVVTAADGEEALAKFRERPPAAIFTDVKMPGMDGFALLRSVKRLAPETPVVLITGFGSEELTTEAREAGAAEVLAKPVTHAELERVLAFVLGGLAGSAMTPGPILTGNPQMEAMLALARRVAQTDATVLIQGETGTGKELLARFIHRQSGRAEGPFVAVNCAALPETLIESELFGHEKGSFTGATGRRAGRFEAASGGTLLLDEVTEIPLSLQAKLLRALQEGEVVRVGSSHPISVDVRVIAITNRDLRKEVAEARFRQDLFYRLNVVSLQPPALRDRAGDILLLGRHFLGKYAGLYRSRAQAFSGEAMQRLLAYAWPGNVRELDNVVQRAVILCTDAEIRPDDIVLEETPLETPTVGGRTMTEVQRDVILGTLARLNGNRTHTAKALGVTVRTIRNHLRKYRAESEAGGGEPLAPTGSDR
jgi:DNA-binding NtrC family response regulator